MCEAATRIERATALLAPPFPGSGQGSDPQTVFALKAPKS